MIALTRPNPWWLRLRHYDDEAVTFSQSAVQCAPLYLADFQEKARHWAWLEQELIFYCTEAWLVTGT